VSEPVRILIADDQALVRGGLRMILDAQSDLEVVGEAADGREALQRARELTPDLVLMDIRMPELDGLEATHYLLSREPSPKVLVLTTFDLDDYVYDAIRAGASGFLLKSAPPQQLVAGIRTVMAGDSLLAPEITRRLLDRFASRPPRPSGTPPALAELSQRELDVLRLIADGRSNSGDRLRPRPQRGDRQDPRHPHPHQTPPPRSRPGRRAGVPDRIRGRLLLTNRRVRSARLADSLGGRLDVSPQRVRCLGRSLAELLPAGDGESSRSGAVDDGHGHRAAP
jgi:DNA-binding NarL/FixJ family response regulator